MHKTHKTFPPGRVTDPSKFRQHLWDYQEDVLKLPSPMRPEQIDAGWTHCFDWFGGVPPPCSRPHMLQARIIQHLGTDTKPTSMRIAKLQRGVLVGNQAYANRGYGQLFPSGEPQWTATDLESPSSSGIDHSQMPDMPLSSPSSNSDADTSVTDEDACFEHN